MSGLLDRHRLYKEALEAVAASTTEADLAALMAELPAAVRDKLARGPLPYRYDCGVCDAFGRAFWSEPKNHRPDDPAFRVWAYHEIAKLQMRRRDDEWYGPAAEDHYLRTIATYKAAGWGSA